MSDEYRDATAEEERVRILMDEEFLTEREARRFLAIGSGKHPGDNREPKPTTSRKH
jgi:hypothetical protein